MMIKRALVPMSLFLTLLWATSAMAAEHWRLVSVPLDMPLDQYDLDGQALEGLYQGDYGTNMPHNFGGYLAHHVKTSGLEESPFYHIDATLRDGRTVELWFSSAEDGRKTFGVYFETPYSDKPIGTLAAAVRQIEGAYGKPDLEFSPPSTPAQKIFVIADRTMDPARYKGVVARLPKPGAISAKDADSFWRADLRDRARILGPDFRGVVIVLNAKDLSLMGETAWLLDLARARTVFNLK